MERNFICKRLGPGDDLADAFSVRLKVFVEEQGFAADSEFDDIDATAHHVVLYDGTRPVATARVFPDQERPGVYIIGRVAVLSECRGGAGRALMEQVELLAAGLGAEELSLGAQCRVQGFYEKLGYRVWGEVYYDEFCPHIHMSRKLGQA